MLRQLFFTVLATVSLLSCKKDKDDDVVIPPPAPIVYAEENPLSLYLQGSGFSQATTNFINSITYEFGYKFIPKEKGRINAVTFKIPAPETNIRVTIWDVASTTALRTLTIPAAQADMETRMAIDTLSVEKNKEYLISYRGNDWYSRKKTDNSATTYPIVAGNISITGYQWIATSGAAQTYPTTVSNTYYAGDLSIVFQRKD